MTAREKAAKATKATKATKTARKATGKATGKTNARPKATTREPNGTMTSAKLVRFGAGSKGHTTISAPQLALALGHTDGGKRLRGWLRSRENDGVYSRYAIDLDSKAGKSLVAAAQKRFKVSDSDLNRNLAKLS